MEGKPLTKEDLMDALNQFIPKLSKAIGDLQKDMTEVKKDVAGLKEDVGGLQKDVAELKRDMVDVKKELARKPDEERVRQIVREELDRNFTSETYRFVRVG